MTARALGRPAGATRTPYGAENPPRRPEVTAGTYRSPERPAKDHSAREARRAERKGWAARARIDRDAVRTVAYHESIKTGPTPERDAVRREQAGAR